MASFMAPHSAKAYALMRIVGGLPVPLARHHEGLRVPGRDDGDACGHSMVVAGPIELIGGILVMIGLQTRWAAFISSGTMAAAYWIGHGTKAVLPVQNGRASSRRSTASSSSSSPPRGPGSGASTDRDGRVRRVTSEERIASEGRVAPTGRDARLWRVLVELSHRVGEPESGARPTCRSGPSSRRRSRSRRVRSSASSSSSTTRTRPSSRAWSACRMRPSSSRSRPWTGSSPPWCAPRRRSSGRRRPCVRIPAGSRRSGSRSV